MIRLRARTTLLATVGLLATGTVAQPPAPRPTLDASADRRAAETERRMTDDERFPLLHGIPGRPKGWMVAWT